LQMNAAPQKTNTALIVVIRHAAWRNFLRAFIALSPNPRTKLVRGRLRTL
jgi:hypothetical protein